MSADTDTAVDLPEEAEYAQTEDIVDDVELRRVTINRYKAAHLLPVSGDEASGRVLCGKSIQGGVDLPVLGHHPNCRKCDREHQRLRILQYADDRQFQEVLQLDVNELRFQLLSLRRVLSQFMAQANADNPDDTETPDTDTSEEDSDDE